MEYYFETGMGLALPGSLARDYSSDLRRKSTRMICWEIIVRHAPASYDHDLNLQFRLQNESERPVATGSSDSWIPANSSSSPHSACWGWSYGNFWEPGQYIFRIVPDGRTHPGENGLLAVIGFTVD